MILIIKKKSITRYDIEKFDGKGDYTLWKAKIIASLGQQKAISALTDPTNLPATLTVAEKEYMEITAYGTVVLSLSDNVLRELIDQEAAYNMWLKLDELYLAKDLQIEHL